MKHQEASKNVSLVDGVSLKYVIDAALVTEEEDKKVAEPFSASHCFF